MEKDKKIDLSEWWAVLTNGEWFVGVRQETPGAKRLARVQKLQLPISVVENEQGLSRPVVLAMTLPWLNVETLIIPDGALWVAVQSMQGPPWEKIISSTEELKRRTRLLNAGFVLPGEGIQRPGH